MENETKRCPFRKRDDGEFAVCYGEECMAYAEYDVPIMSWSLHDKDKVNGTEHIATCKMLPMPTYYNCAYTPYKEDENAD